MYCKCNKCGLFVNGPINQQCTCGGLFEDFGAIEFMNIDEVIEALNELKKVTHGIYYRTQLQRITNWLKIGDLAHAEPKGEADSIRDSVLNALLKHHKARELAQLKTCPLCGHKIGEHILTVMNFESLDTIGIAAVQCSNKGCLLHRGIVYEEEGERLRVWQSKNRQGISKDEEDNT